jgi:uncharacterized protein (UPF0332 family)
MTERVAGFLQKAHATLDHARMAAEAGFIDGAINRAYYAAFYAASAALLARDEAPRTHAGVHNRFWVTYVQTGQIPSEVGSILPHAFSTRQRADYEALSAFDAPAAADLIADVARFLAAVEPLLTDDPTP